MTRDPLAGGFSAVVFFVERDDRERLRALVDAGLPGLQVRLGEATHCLEHQGRRLLPLVARSIRRFYTASRIVVLTDPGTEVPALPPPAAVQRRPLGDRPLMFERLVSYIEYLESAGDDEAHLFLDSDILITGPFGTACVGPFDLAFTYKVKRGRWSINAGVILVAPGGRARALAFFRRTLALYEERHVADPHWGSDQMAMRDTIGLGEPPEALQIAMTADARVALLPCDKYNYSPAGVWRDLSDGPSGQFVWHFKGRLKKFMPWFYRAHLAPGATDRIGARAVVTLRVGHERLRAAVGRVIRGS